MLHLTHPGISEESRTQLCLVAGHGPRVGRNESDVGTGVNYICICIDCHPFSLACVNISYHRSCMIIVNEM